MQNQSKGFCGRGLAILDKPSGKLRVLGGLEERAWEEQRNRLKAERPENRSKWLEEEKWLGLRLALFRAGKWPDLTCDLSTQDWQKPEMEMVWIAVCILDPFLVSSWLSAEGLRVILQKRTQARLFLCHLPAQASLVLIHLPSLPERQSPRYGALLLNSLSFPLEGRAYPKHPSSLLCTPAARQGDASWLPGKQPWWAHGWILKKKSKFGSESWFPSNDSDCAHFQDYDLRVSLSAADSSTRDTVLKNKSLRLEKLLSWSWACPACTDPTYIPRTTWNSHGSTHK